MKQGKWGKIISGAVIVLSLAMVLIIVFTSTELDQVWEKLFTLDTRWLLAAVLCYAAYVFSEGAGLWAFLRMEGFKVKLPSAAHFSLAGMYYANITPSSTGGQPMQVYLMSQRGVSAAVATSALTARYFFNQLALVAMTLLLWAMNWDFVMGQVGHVAGVIVLGCVVNFACVPIIIAIMCNRRLVEAAARWGIRLLTKVKLCKHPEKWEQKSMEAIDHFHTSLMNLVKRPGHILLQLLFSVLEMTFLMLVPLVVYKALGLSGTPWQHILTISFLLFVSASYTPLPGASGAQEGGFLVYFRGIFPEGSISIALLVWRFMTYYLCLLVGGADQVYVSLRKRRGKIEREGAAPANEQEGTNA